MTELHLHTNIGSRLDAMASSFDYAKLAKKNGHKSLAITDHGRMTGILNHQKACLENDIKPIFGVEAYLTDELTSLNEKNKRIRTKTNHIILLAKNEIGYKNLLYLNYISYKDVEHYYYNNRILEKELFDNSEGIIVGTACLASKWNRLIMDGKIKEAEKLFVKYRDHFKDNFYTEIQINEITNTIDKAEFGQKTVNEVMMSFAEKYDVPIYIGGDVHYLNPGDDLLQSVSIAIRNKETMDNLSWELESRHMYYKNEITVLKLNKEFGYNYDERKLKNYFNNSDLIAEKCNFLLPERKQMFLPKLYDDDDKVLITKAKNALNKMFDEIPVEYSNRLNLELELIIRKGFSSYLLVLEDIFQFIKKENIWVGAGRGCYTENAMVFTNNGFKKIKDVKIGDTVINEKGEEDTVINTFIYDINEELYDISYVHSSNTFSPKQCTGDHKQLIRRNEKNIWVETKNINPETDLICLPKIKEKKINEIKEFDLLDYNIFNYEYDENYIYEKVNANKNSFVIKKIKRKVKVDKNFFRMIGLLAGDGWVPYYDSNSSKTITLAINNSNKKDKWNRKEFEIFYDKFFDTREFLYENISKTKKLTQLYINSKIISNFAKEEMIFYDLNKQKYIDEKWVNQSNKNIRNIWKGLLYSDGYWRRQNRSLKINFDNTSLKLITNFCEISNRLGLIPSISHKDKYLCNESYKVRTDLFDRSNLQDEDYYYMDINKIKKLKKRKCKVYDLSIKNHQSFMIDNMITHNSGGGSIVLYLLNITKIDPIKYNLLFERFLSNERSIDVVYDYFGEAK